MTGPFARHAREYLNAGLVPIPCGPADNGKRPRIKWRSIQEPGTLTSVLIDRWVDGPLGDCNVGTLTGPSSGLTVVDIDDAALIEMAVARFGETPVIARTPRGGAHLLYKHAGEPSATALEEQKIDVKGAGGFIVLPPSIRPDNGAQYWFERGGLADLRRLPAIRHGSLPNRQSVMQANQDRRLRDGDGRNTALFMALKERLASRPVGTLEEAIIVAEALAERLCADQLSVSEVSRVARSVFRYQVEGRLITKGMRYALISKTEIEHLDSLAAEQVDRFARLAAADVLQRARLAFGGSRDPFPLSTVGLSTRSGVGRRLIARGRDMLEQAGIVRRVHTGGSGKGDPHLYVWGKGAGEDQ